MLRKSVLVLLTHHGFRLDEDGRSLYLNPQAFAGGWIRFLHLDGSNRRMKVAGSRTFRVGQGLRQAVSYNLGFRIEVEHVPSQGWMLIPKLFLRLRNEQGEPLVAASALSRRKKITRDWWNGKQLNTHLAFLAAIQMSQRVAQDSNLDVRIALDSSPVFFTANKAINELLLGIRNDDEAAESELDPVSEIDATDEIGGTEEEEVST